MKHLLRSTVVLAALLVVTLTSTSSAIPPFARKYNTSCMTCHIAFPKLNAFGEAFRRNGYQFPDGGDAAAIKQEPVPLGAEGNKRAFPDAVWPGSIPGSLPVGVNLIFDAGYNPNQDVKWNLASLKGEAELTLGGTLGEDIGFFGVLIAGGEGIEVERGYLVFSNLLGGQNASFNAKVGGFDPGVFSFSGHRNYTGDPDILNATVGDNKWALEPSQPGIELNGVLAGRFGYNVGVVDGMGNALNRTKDMYLHATYKIGGLRLDGVPDAKASAGPTQAWEDNSVTLGAMMYSGTADLNNGASDSTAVAMTDNFKMIGGDVNVWLNRLNLIGAFAKRDNSSPFFATPGTSAKMTSMMVEASYIVYPWMIPYMKYETTKMDGATETNTSLVGSVVFLIRANIRASFEADFRTQAAPTDTDPNATAVKFDQLGFNLRFAM